MTPSTKQQLTDILTRKERPWDRVKDALAFIESCEVSEEPKKKRTDPQNRSLHLWLTWVASELDKNGHTLQDVVKAIRRAEVRPTMQALKEVLWKPYQIAALNKESTTQLEKHEVDKVYEGLNKFLADNFDGMHIPWPCEEGKSNDMLNSLSLRKKLEDKNII